LRTSNTDNAKTDIYYSDFYVSRVYTKVDHLFFYGNFVNM